MTDTRPQAGATRLAAGAVLALGATFAPLAAGNDGPGDGASQPIRDAWIDGRLETTYVLNPHLEALDIETDVADGVVTLRGVVASDIDRDLAVAIARGLSGVREVDDQLTVGERGNAGEPAGPADGDRSFSQWVRDATATARVKTNLVANGNTRGLAIDVDTENDVVTLSGAVRSRKEKLLAEMIARNTDGIARVDNRLEIDQRS
ncbi:MAG: histidine kinase [Gammaproteobacteria bacterium]|nr:histidine kinase [Gammaproteobacteria bacterium]|tara:strand:+ start:1498 stop:2112 length:615 start_codon:yes stop_codon:yes gene_type:complete